MRVSLLDGVLDCVFEGVTGTMSSSPLHSIFICCSVITSIRAAQLDGRKEVLYILVYNFNVYNIGFFCRKATKKKS